MFCFFFAHDFVSILIHLSYPSFIEMFGVNAKKQKLHLEIYSRDTFVLTNKNLKSILT